MDDRYSNLNLYVGDVRGMSAAAVGALISDAMYGAYEIAFDTAHGLVQGRVVSCDLTGDSDGRFQMVVKKPKPTPAPPAVRVGQVWKHDEQTSAWQLLSGPSGEGWNAIGVSGYCQGMSTILAVGFEMERGWVLVSKTLPKVEVETESAPVDGRVCVGCKRPIDASQSVSYIYATNNMDRTGWYHSQCRETPANVVIKAEAPSPPQPTPRELLRKAIEHEAKSPPVGICEAAWLSWLSMFTEQGENLNAYCGDSVRYFSACVAGVHGGTRPEALLALHEKHKPRQWWDGKR